MTNSNEAKDTSRICTCVKCGEQDDYSTRTGASIDGKYHCESCYNSTMEKSEGF